MTPEHYQQVGQIYRAALEVDAERRAAFLAQACGGDEALQREVESLLGYDGHAGLIDQPALEVVAHALAEEWTRSLIGRQVGHYRILSWLGAGGMGEVYLGLDLILQRQVALKLLPAAFTADGERVRRFAREARAASALNHPNIITIHEIGALADTHYIVSEYVAGETLRRQMTAAPGQRMKPADALAVAGQIAAALAAAHEAGIMHRDIKPENVMVRRDGLVKVLDFGLAKLTERAAPAVDSRVGTAGTAAGVVLGTPRYMSPEQARGERVDTRTDIFSFGVLLYELLAGRAPFTGATASEMIAAILRDEPLALRETNGGVSPQLEKIVRRCLEKLPERRFQSAADLGFALASLSAVAGTEPTEAVAVAEPAPKPKLRGRREWIAWIAATVFALSTLAMTLLYARRPSPASPATRFSIPLPKGTTTIAAFAPVLALAPDGRQLVFSTLIAGNRQLWLRPLDSFVTQPLAGTDGATFPFWSPDSGYIAFFADNKLKKLNVASGVIETICAAGAGGGGTWNQQGVILFSNGEGAALSRVNVAGGKPEAVTVPDAAQGETNHNYPSFLPDGKHYLFQVYNGETPGIHLGSLDSPNRRLLIRLSADTANATNAVWAPPGYILYALNRNVLLARAFALDRLELQGEPVRVAENVIVGGSGMAAFTVSANGTLAFVQYRAADSVQLAWHDRNGKPLGAIGPAALWTQFRLSPDERFAALQREEQSRLSSLWLLDLVRNTTTRFITEGHNLFPVWSPDSRRLAFGSARNGPPNIFLKALAGNAPEERWLESRFQCDASSWSPDGKYLVFTMTDPQTRRDIWLLPMSGDRRPQPFLRAKANEQGGKVSPDGNWLAYQSDESGNNEIYVTQFPQPVRSWRVSTSGGTTPNWRGDGRELFFVSGGKLLAMSVSGGTEFQAGTPQPLFEIEGLAYTPSYAPSKDGRRFLVGVVTEKAPVPPINVVLNWTAPNPNRERAWLYRRPLREPRYR